MLASQQRRAEREAKRKAQNELLKANGYRWEKRILEYDGEYHGDRWQWILRDPKGNEIEVEAALRIIEIGLDAYNAEVEAEKIEHEQQKAVRAAQIAENKKHNQAVLDEFDAIHAKIQAECRILAGNEAIRIQLAQWQKVYDVRDHIKRIDPFDFVDRALDAIFTTERDGSIYFRVVFGTSFDDDGRVIYYSNSIDRPSPSPKPIKSTVIESNVEVLKKAPTKASLSKSISTPLDPETAALVAEECSKMRLTNSQFVRFLLKQHLDNAGIGNTIIVKQNHGGSRKGKTK